VPIARLYRDGDGSLPFLLLVFFFFFFSN
jgi:hypothetical protein